MAAAAVGTATLGVAAAIRRRLEAWAVEMAETAVARAARWRSG